MNGAPTIIITGSSGFIGSYFVSNFAKSGYNVRAFQKKIPDKYDGNITYYPFELADIKDMGFRGADYLIHLAYQPVLHTSETKINIAAAEKIISLCRKYGIKIIFFSSMSAHPKAESIYGKHKLIIENMLDTDKDLILRPGFVIGKDGGLFGNIASFIKKHKIVPLIGGGKQKIQIMALDDLYSLVSIAIKKNLTGKFTLAHPAAVEMKDLYKEIARSAGAKPIFVPIPTFMAYLLILLVEKLGIHMPITSENILGLKQLKIEDTVVDLKLFGLKIKDHKTALSNL